MPTLSCQRCGKPLKSSAVQVSMSTPVPPQLMIAGVSKEGIGVTCDKCRRLINGIHLTLRKQPALRSAPPVPPANRGFRIAPRSTELEVLQAATPEIASHKRHLSPCEPYDRALTVKRAARAADATCTTESARAQHELHSWDKSTSVCGK